MTPNNLKSIKSENNLSQSIIRYSLVLVPALLIFVFYHKFFPYHIYLKEQIRLFVLSSEYFLSYLNKPTPLSSFSGDFFMQFYYLKGGGPIIITICFYIIWLLVFQILKRKNQALKLKYIWAFIPAFIDSLLNYHLSYSLTHTFSIILFLVLFLISQSILESKWNYLTIPILITIGYFCIGVIIIILPIILLADKLAQKTTINLWSILLALAIPIFLTIILRSHYLITIKDAFTYPYSPILYLIPLLIFFIIVFSQIINNSKVINILYALSILSIPFLFLTSPPNFTREKVLALDIEGYFGNWDKVISDAEKISIKNKLASYSINLTLSKYGILPDRLFEFYQPFSKSLFLDVGPESGWLEIFISNEAYYQIGDMNLTQHAAHLGLIFSPYNRSSRMIKRLAETNMVIGEEEAALKYLHMLEKTLFHHKWAQKRIQMIENPSLLSKEYTDKQLLLPQTDTLRKGEDNLSGLRLLVQSNPDNKAALDYLLCYHLLNKDLTNFKTDFEKYFTFNRQLPRLYGEALLIILYQQKASNEEISKYFIQSSLMNEFIKYTDEYSLANGQRPGLSNRFRNTYWFYYHFAQKRLE